MCYYRSNLILTVSSSKDGDQLIQLSNCANDILSKLDDCKPDDLACECCALESMDQKCFGLCRYSPSAKFLDQIVLDCAALSEVNSCGLPFKKNDQADAKVSRSSIKSNSRKHSVDVQQRIKSVVGSNAESATEPSKESKKAGTQVQIPGAIVLSSRIKNNSTGVDAEVASIDQNKEINSTSVNATSCNSGSSTTAPFTLTILICGALIMVSLGSFI